MMDKENQLPFTSVLSPITFQLGPGVAMDANVQAAIIEFLQHLIVQNFPQVGPMQMLDPFAMLPLYPFYPTFPPTPSNPFMPFMLPIAAQQALGAIPNVPQVAPHDMMFRGQPEVQPIQNVNNQRYNPMLLKKENEKKYASSKNSRTSDKQQREQVAKLTLRQHIEKKKNGAAPDVLKLQNGAQPQPRMMPGFATSRPTAPTDQANN